MKTDPSRERPGQLRIGAGLARYMLRATLRNKAGYFFSMVFPLVFIIVFGLFSDARAAARLGIPAEMDRSSPVYQVVERAAEESGGAVELVRGSERELRRRLEQGTLGGMLDPAPETRGRLVLLPSGAARNEALVLRTFIRTVAGEMSLRAAGITSPAYTVETAEAVGRPHRHLDYILPGQIGFSMLALATFGIGFNLLTLRKTLVLKRMFATAVHPLTFVVAQGLSRSLQGVLQTVVLLGVGVAAFGVTLANGWQTAGAMLVLSFLGVVAFIGFGIVAANLSDDEHVVSVLLNLFNLPQVLLAGVFFSTESLPGWMQGIGSHLPLAYLNTSLRSAALDGAGLLELWPFLLGMFAWGVAAYLLAAKTFRTE